VTRQSHKGTGGRGALSNPANRYEACRREEVDDGWNDTEEIAPLRTEVNVDASRTIISYNRSPDVPFDRSINPYRGCEHGCVYCYARPTHAWLGLSPGLDFESRLFQKPEAASLLREELAKPSYRPAPLTLGANTDPYQPLERRLRITRSLLEILQECHHPVMITTKSALLLRDLDILAPMARQKLAAVLISLTTLDSSLARRMEPRAVTPGRRLETLNRLADAGVPVGVLVAPLIPGINDQELERILAVAAAAGATRAGTLLIRLPLEIKELFEDWLKAHFPARASRVLNLIRQCRGGKLYQPEFGLRMSGTGPYAALLQQRFELAIKRLGLNDHEGSWELDCSRFRAPLPPTGQLQFDWPNPP
jgi:DNA repair photolyase